MLESRRVDWVDVLRGIAIIFVYLGHWLTARVDMFAYAFHLELLFMISGFFAVQSEKKLTTILCKKARSLLLPMFLWACISFIIARFDSETFSLRELSVLITSPSSAQPNYWFFPVIFSVSIVFAYIYIYICKNKLIIALSLYIIMIFFGENPIFNLWNDIMSKLGESSVFNIVNAWFSVSGLCQYLFWYALGAFLYPHFCKYADLRKTKSIVFHSLGLFFLSISAVLFLCKITDIGVISAYIQSNLFIFKMYKTFAAICICFGALYISILLEHSLFLQECGKYSLILMGLEFITHSYLPLAILPMLNMGIPAISTTVHVLTITLCTLWINCRLARKINRYFPILNGKW